MSTVSVLSHGLDDWRRGELIFGGDLLVFTRVAALDRFREHVDTLIRAAFDGADPQYAQFSRAPSDYLDTVRALQQRVRRDERARLLFLDALESLGVAVDDAYWDWIYLRVLPSGETHASPRTAKVDMHRDTWSSNVQAQTNWWTPIYPIVAERALAFYPRYWSRRVANTSADWDIDEMRAERRRTGASKVATTVPHASAPVDTSSELRVVVEPGDLLCFSGAHLHASVPNTSGATRFSVEVRTVSRHDLATGRGAPNLDGDAPRTPLHWFRHTVDGTSLADLPA